MVKGSKRQTEKNSERIQQLFHEPGKERRKGRKAESIRLIFNNFKGYIDIIFKFHSQVEHIFIVLLVIPDYLHLMA